MADTKTSALTAVTTLTGTSELPLNEAGTSKKATVTQVINNIDVAGQTKIVRLTGDHSIASTTATEVTDLNTTLVAGSYLFEYFLLLQTDATTTGVGIGVNYTGTATKFAFTRRFVSTGTTTTTGMMEDIVNNIAGAFVEGYAATAETTTAVNTTNAGAAATTVDSLNILEGIIVASGGGDLELWHGSELANTTRVRADSLLRITRVA